MSHQIPFGILSDSPDCSSGLARITRDLCWHIHRHLPQLKLGSFGFWGTGSSQFPWTQYQLGSSTDDLSRLPSAWADFAAHDPGILLTIYDAPRLLQLARPDLIKDDPDLAHFLLRKPFELWGYFPVDGAGPNFKLSSIYQDIFPNFDRVLAYGPYGADVINNTLGVTDTAWISHGLYTDTFRPLGIGGRDLLPNLSPADRLLGVVATNQARKDWGTVFSVLSQLGSHWKLWAHTDKTIGHWSFPALADDFSVRSRVMVTQSLPDHALAQLYSACDVTFAPGLGEGFGYPIVESLFCQTQVVHVDYAGGSDLIDEGARLIPPSGYRLEGAYNILRPVLNPERVTEYLLAAADAPRPAAPDRYTWANVWPQWHTWITSSL